MAEYIPQRLGIIIDNLPGPTESIIAREIELLEQMGYSICIFVLHGNGHSKYRLGLNARTFFEKTNISGLVLDGLAAIPTLARNYPSGLIAGAASFFRMLYHSRTRGKLCRGLFQALHIAGSFALDGEITNLFSFYSDHTAAVTLLVSRFSGVDFNFNATARDITRQDRHELLEKLRHARFVTVQATYYKNYLQLLGEFSTPVYIFCHGIDLEKFPLPRRFRQPAPPYRMLTVAEINGQQDFEFILQGLTLLQREKVNFIYTVIGAGPQKNLLQAMVDHYGLQSRVILKEKIKQDELFEEYLGSDVFIFIGKTAEDGSMDDIPDVLLESMAVGLPVVTAPHGAIPELIENEETGILLEENKPEKLADACLLLLEDDITRELIVIKGRLKVESRYNIATRIAEFVEICEENDLLA